MKNVIATIVAAAGLASMANAQATSNLNMETSIDGLDWTSGLRNVNPGTTVKVRAKISYTANGTTAVPVGFATLTFQPTIQNWNATPVTGDAIAAFAAAGNNNNGGGVQRDNQDLYGRIIPFASTGPTTTDPYIGRTQTVSGTSYLRIARSTITNWVGDGPTTTTSAVNNFNGSGGLALVQKGSGLVGTADPAFDPNIVNVILFRFQITLSLDSTIRDLLIDVPAAGINRNTSTGAREAGWFASASDSFGSIKAAVSVGTSTLRVVPAPGALGLLGLGGVMVLRRRR